MANNYSKKISRASLNRYKDYTESDMMLCEKD